MRIIKHDKDKMYSLDTKEISLKNLPNLSNKIVSKILSLLAVNELYPKQIAKKLGVHEQNVYYYIKKLENSKLIKITKTENVNGTYANYYGLINKSVFVKFGEFEVASTIQEKKSSYLEPYILEGRLNSLIVVGSPDPHGPQKARSRDGYFGMDLALFLGSFLNFIPESRVRLDTEITQKELETNHLIIIGGPIVNKVTGMINNKLPVYFDTETKGLHSKVTGKKYFNDEIGMINKINSPFNKDKKILILAGIRNSGTKAGILAFLKHFALIKKGNLFDEKINSKVVEGIDLDSDGVVDDVEFLE
jgi:DNA-binding transcriptional ArsR family regulator